jgi:oligopeptide/dipeptide ABC transporter ATP-binding protein
MSMADKTILSVRDLRTYFYTDDGVVKAVDGISFDIEAGQTLALVGESGCGKSVTALSILRLIPAASGKIESGEIVWQDRDIVGMSDEKVRAIRGNEISMIFQEPMSSLNPVYTIGNQIAEAIVLHQKLDKAAARYRAIELLEKVRIPSPEHRVDEYPHQLSGGMKQRAMIAMALACNPTLLIADEPTTALDVTIQAQILALLKELQEEFNMSILLITHNLGIVAGFADDVNVMYAGWIFEKASCEELFANPKNPYTLGLFKSIPRPGEQKEKLETIPGEVPNPLDYPKGCHFNTRCPYKIDRCLEEEPPLEEKSPGHLSACFVLD